MVGLFTSRLARLVCACACALVTGAAGLLPVGSALVLADAPAAWAAVSNTATAAAGSAGGSAAGAADSSTGDSPSDTASASESDESAQEEGPRGATSVDGKGENKVDPTQRSDSSFIYDTDIATLIDSPGLYDGQTVQVVGEVVGDIIVVPGDGGYRWISLTSPESDEPSTISVYLTETQTHQIDSLGRYGITGTMLQVRGIFYEANTEHEGASEIKATYVDVVEKGAQHPDTFDVGKFIPGALLVAVGLVLMFVFRVVRERQR